MCRPMDVLLTQQNVSVLKCQSRTNPGSFWLYKKNKSKWLANGSESTYYGCLNCLILGAEEGGVMVRDNQIVSDPEVGHNILCVPKKPLVEKGCENYKFLGCKETMRHYYGERAGGYMSTVCVCNNKPFCNAARKLHAFNYCFVLLLLVFVFEHRIFVQYFIPSSQS
uniref:Uncharacterized protein n=1 Tax=Romanomermis culicivorax TaxID=13658 RepID=A0A915I913_ROMCU